MTDIADELDDLSPGPSWELSRLGRKGAAEIRKLRATNTKLQQELATLRRSIHSKDKDPDT